MAGHQNETCSWNAKAPAEQKLQVRRLLFSSPNVRMRFGSAVRARTASTSKKHAREMLVCEMLSNKQQEMLVGRVKDKDWPPLGLRNLEFVLQAPSHPFGRSASTCRSERKTQVVIEREAF